MCRLPFVIQASLLLILLLFIGMCGQYTDRYTKCKDHTSLHTHTHDIMRSVNKKSEKLIRLNGGLTRHSSRLAYIRRVTIRIWKPFSSHCVNYLITLMICSFSYIHVVHRIVSRRLCCHKCHFWISHN